MTSQEYIKNAVKTDLSDYSSVIARLSDPRLARILHATIGLSTEAGELLDIIKKYTMYGKPVDLVHLKEEVADCLWYIALLADTLDFSFEELYTKNIAKLKTRYGDKFTENAATNRDLQKERQTLEA